MQHPFRPKERVAGAQARKAVDKVLAKDLEEEATKARKEMKTFGRWNRRIGRRGIWICRWEPAGGR